MDLKKLKKIINNNNRFGDLPYLSCHTTIERELVIIKKLERQINDKIAFNLGLN